MISELYKRTLYLNKDIDYLFRNEILEYDMKEAGYNLIKYFNLLDEDKIRLLDSFDKQQRHVKIGIYQKDKEFAKELSNAFMSARKMFFEANDIQDEDILSIKKDAIFLRNKHCSSCEFDNIIFRIKNIYNSYLRLDNNEYYFSKENVDVKGISDEVIEKHKDYMLDFLHEFTKIVETSNRNIQIKWLTEFIKYYRNRELDISYYRELNKQGMFRIMDSSIKDGMYYSDIGRDDNSLNIMFNYVNIITPLISIIL